MLARNQILIRDSTFWVRCRGKQFGPFDYEWSNDLHGMELTFRGQKFGEICSKNEIFADLAEFRLPLSVCRVAAITAGTLAVGIVEGQCEDQRVSALIDSLESFGLERFLICVQDDESES